MHPKALQGADTAPQQSGGAGARSVLRGLLAAAQLCRGISRGISNAAPGVERGDGRGEAPAEPLQHKGEVEKRFQRGTGASGRTMG